MSFLGRAAPALEEAALLRDALRQLDELFLLVVVGEFNSGESAGLCWLARAAVASGKV